MSAGPFHSGLQTGCLIAIGLFAVIFMLGKCAQYMGVQ